MLKTEGTQDLVFQIEQGDLRSELTRQVEVSTRRLQVLMLAHRPRWEMRYLQVAHSATIPLSSIVGLSDRRYAVVRYRPRELPLTRDELNYDVIIIGDQRPSSIPSQGQMPCGITPGKWCWSVDPR